MIIFTILGVAVSLLVILYGVESFITYLSGFFHKSTCCNARTIADDAHRWCTDCGMPKFDATVPAHKWGGSPYEN